MFKSLKFVLTAVLFAFTFVIASNVSFAQDSVNTNSNGSSDMNSNSNTEDMNSTTPSTDNNTGFAEKHARELQTRLSLSDDQTKQVESILSDYQETAQASTDDNTSMEAPSKAQAAVSDKIEDVLDNNQRAQFDQVKETWWASVTQDMGTSKETPQKNNTDTY